MRCPSCEAPVPDGARFCGRCGASTVQRSPDHAPGKVERAPGRHLPIPTVRIPRPGRGITLLLAVAVLVGTAVGVFALVRGAGRQAAPATPPSDAAPQRFSRTLWTASLVGTDDPLALLTVLDGGGGTAVVAGPGGLRGFDVATGELRWSQPNEPWIDPVVAADAVVVAAPLGGDGQELRAYSVADGRLAWRLGYPTAIRAMGGGDHLTLVVDGGGGGGDLVRIDDGEIRWRVPLPDDPAEDAPPEVAAGDGVVAVAQGSTITVVGADDGDSRWSVPQLPVPAHDHRLVVGGGVVLLAGPQRVHAYDVTDGRERWSVPSASVLFRPALTDDGMVVLADPFGRLTGVSLATGEQRWSLDVRPLGTAPRAAPRAAVHGDRVFLIDELGRVVALQARTGHEVWSAAVLARIPPVAVGDRLLVGTASGGVRLLAAVDGAVTGEVTVPLLRTPAPVGRGDDLFLLDHSGSLVALDSGSGQTRWSGAWDGAGAPALHPGGRMLLVPGPDRVAGVDIGDGSIAWEEPVRAPTWWQRARSVAVADDLAVVAGMDDVVGLDPRTGASRWVTRLDGELLGAPLARVRSATIAVTTVGAVWALDDRGEHLWRRDLGSPPAGAPASNAAIVVVAGADGRLNALDAASGELRWTAEIGTIVGVSIDDHTIAVALGSGELAAVDPQDGSVVWRVRIGEPITAGPVFDGGDILLGTDAGTVLSLGVDDGLATGQLLVGSPVSALSIVDGVIYAVTADGSVIAAR